MRVPLIIEGRTTERKKIVATIHLSLGVGKQFKAIPQSNARSKSSDKKKKLWVELPHLATLSRARLAYSDARQTVCFSMRFFLEQTNNTQSEQTQLLTFIRAERSSSAGHFFALDHDDHANASRREKKIEANKSRRNCYFSVAQSTTEDSESMTQSLQ